MVEVLMNGSPAGLVILDSEAAIAAYSKDYSDPRLATVKKDGTVPKVGDVVCFNDSGLEQVFGSATGNSFMKKLELRITHVDDESLTYPEPTFAVRVDDPEIDRFLIDHTCFDIVRRV